MTVDAIKLSKRLIMKKTNPAHNDGINKEINDIPIFTIFDQEYAKKWLVQQNRQ